MALVGTLLLVGAACGGTDSEADGDGSADQSTAASANGGTETTASTASTESDGNGDESASDGSSETTAVDDAAEAATDSGDLGPIASMLAYIPDARENRLLLTINDYDGALAAAGTEWPASEDDEAVAEVFGDLSFRLEPPILIAPVAFGDRLFPLDEWRTEVGFSIVDAERDASTGEAPGRLSIVRTRRPAPEIESAVRSDPTWSADLNEVGDGDGAYFAWGDDPLALEIDRDRASAARPLGRGGAMAVLDDGTVIRSPDPEVVEASLAATNDEIRSLLDDGSYASVARALDAADVYSAHLTSENITVDPLYLLGPFDGPPPSAEEVQARLDEITTVPPYLALGIGNKVDLDVAPQGVLVLVFAAVSPEAAEQTVAAVEEIVASGNSIAVQAPWSELLSVTSTSVDGSVAVIELRTDNPRIGINSFQQRDTLFVSF